MSFIRSSRKTQGKRKKLVWAKITLPHQKILDMRCYEADTSSEIRYGSLCNKPGCIGIKKGGILSVAYP